MGAGQEHTHNHSTSECLNLASSNMLPATLMRSKERWVCASPPMNAMNAAQDTPVSLHASPGRQSGVLASLNNDV